jgi:hypothetical protein
MAERVNLNITPRNTDTNSIPASLVPRRLDPVELEKQSKYRSQGLTYVSNNDSIIPRDDAGNIAMTEDSDNNPLLIIDPVAEKVTTKSLLKVLNTRFEYYKFPVQVRTSGSVELNVDLNLDQDPVYARYKPSEDRFILVSNQPSGILLDEVVEGLPQNKTNAYYISKELKNSGVDLRIRVKVSHNFIGTGDFGTCYFTLTKAGPNFPLDRYYRPVQNREVPGFETYSNGDGTINRGETQELFFEEIIRNSEFEIGDAFSIAAVAGQPNEHTILADQTYMVVTDASKRVDEWNQPILIRIPTSGSGPRLTEPNTLNS